MTDPKDTPETEAALASGETFRWKCQHCSAMYYVDRGHDPVCYEPACVRKRLDDVELNLTTTKNQVGYRDNLLRRCLAQFLAMRESKDLPCPTSHLISDLYTRLGSTPDYEPAPEVKPISHTGTLMIRDVVGAPVPHPVPDAVYIHVQQLEAAVKSAISVLGSHVLVERMQRIMDKVT